MKRAAQLIVALCLVPTVLAGQQTDTIYNSGDGVSLPTVVKMVRPNYTSEAMQQRIEGKVGLECVVRADAKITDVKVVRSLDSVYGLDKNAVAALEQSEFKPGQKDNKPVSVRIQVEMAFTLK